MPDDLTSVDLQETASTAPHSQALIGMIESKWTAKHVLVLGDVMLDKYIWGDVERISPEAPIPIVRVARSTQQPGGAANVAMNLAELGAPVSLAGVVGDDDDGCLLRTRLESAGIRNRLTVVADRPTTSKTRILGAQQQMMRLDLESSDMIPGPAQDALLSSAFDALNTPPPTQAAGVAGPVSAIVLSDYAKGVLSESVCQAVIQRALKVDLPVIVDPKGQDYCRYRGASMLCPNLAELALATGMPVADMDAVLSAGEDLLEELQIECLVVTLSARGIVVLAKDSGCKTRQHFPARAQQVFDVSGAGDTVTAVLALCLASRLGLSESMHLANLAAGIVIGKVGTAPVHAHELIAALARESTASGGKILPIEQMALRVKGWRAGGDRIVFTNGCFDLLHSGHITLLEEARCQGDRLIIGLNSDRSIRGLKGTCRPLTEEEDRARVLAALSVVDGVVVYDDATPLATVLALRPDVLVKGGDYEKSEIVGAREVQSWGGDVVIVPLLAGFSTTRILAKAFA